MNETPNSEFRRESHWRSLLKGISWRCVATVDTILVALLAMWLLKSEFDFAHAIADATKIGLYEFFIKLAVYYVHERVWERLRHGDGHDQARTLKKSISWRIIATTMTFVIAGAILDSFDHVALTIAIIEFFTKFILYYVHERIWLKLPLGRVRRWFKRD
jgi:uncharacterized membrane protein